jgi:hypothetical protein
MERGPEVRTQTLRLRGVDAPRGSLTEINRVGGVVSDADGAPVPDAWIVVPSAGAWGTTDAEGRFRLERVPAGEHRVLARGPDGTEAEATLTVPGGGVDIVLGPPPPAKPASRRKK